MRFLLYDIETAGSFNTGSICSVGWLLLENDDIVNSGYSLINPCCPFKEQNISINGITPADVEGSPTFSEYWESTLKSLMSSSIVIAHNANFDLSETEQALFNAKIQDPGIDYFDSLEMCKNLFSADSYKLSSLCEMIGYKYSAHNALEDVKALYILFETIKKSFHFSDFAEMLLRSHVAVENTLSNTYDPQSAVQAHFFNYDHTSRCREDVEAIDQKFSGLRFCFTGDIPGYDRADLERIIKQHGGRMTGSVSSKTDFLIVGIYEEFGSGYISGKQKAALELIDGGGKIQIITPDTFFSMIESGD